MDFEEWERTVPEAITGDALWKVKAYRLALYAAFLGWRDVTKLMGDRRTLGLADQLYRALGSVDANLAEGYSHSTGPDRARFLEYSLGSARESRDWYYKGQEVLGATVVSHRLDLLTQIARLLLTMIPQRRGSLREPAAPYDGHPPDAQDQATEEALNMLLSNVPLPAP